MTNEKYPNSFLLEKNPTFGAMKQSFNAANCVLFALNNKSIIQKVSP